MQKKYLIPYIGCLLWLFCVTNLPAQVPADVVSRARKHPIEMNKPAVDFFEGAISGNGAMGVVITTRPDAVCFHFGHNNVWDIRVAENHKDKIGTFDEIFKKAKALSPDLRTIWDDKEFSDYLHLTADNYRKPYATAACIL